MEILGGPGRVRGELGQQVDAVADRREACHVGGEGCGASLICGVSEHGEGLLSDTVRGALMGAHDPGNAEVLGAVGAVVLVAGDGHDHHRCAGAGGLLDAVEATVGYEQRAVGEQVRDGELGLDADVRCWARPDCAQLVLESDPDDDVEHLGGEPVDDGLVQPRGAEEDGAQAGEHGWVVR